MNSRYLFAIILNSLAVTPSCQFVQPSRVNSRVGHEPNVHSDEVYDRAVRIGRDRKVPDAECPYFITAYIAGVYDTLVSDYESIHGNDNKKVYAFDLGFNETQPAIKSNQEERWRLLRGFGYKKGRIHGIYTPGQLTISGIKDQIWRLRNFSGCGIPLGEVVVEGLISDDKRIYSSTFQREIIVQKIVSIH